MPEGMTDAQITVDEVSSRLFDSLVDEVLQGNPKEVVVTWEDAISEDGEAYQTPKVTIGGRSAYNYVRRPMEYTTTDTALIEATAKAFEEKVGTMWGDTMAYYRELEELDGDMDTLATSRDAGFFDKARTLLQEEGINSVGDGEIVTTARQLACTALTEWADAIEAQSISAEEELTESDKRYKIIEAMLDEIYPMEDSMPEDVADAVDSDRQSLALRSGWSKMSIQELEGLWLAGDSKTLPYAS